MENAQRSTMGQELPAYECVLQIYSVQDLRLLTHKRLCLAVGHRLVLVLKTIRSTTAFRSITGYTVAAEFENLSETYATVPPFTAGLRTIRICHTRRCNAGGECKDIPRIFNQRDSDTPHLDLPLHDSEAFRAIRAVSSEARRICQLRILGCSAC